LKKDRIRRTLLVQHSGQNQELRLERYLFLYFGAKRSIILLNIEVLNLKFHLDEKFRLQPIKLHLTKEVKLRP